MTSKKSGAAGTLFEIEGDRLLARAAAHSSRFIKLTVVAPPVTSKRARPTVRIGFVLDRSGSMQGNPIYYARKAILDGIDMLSGRDEFAVVSFDDRVETPVSLTGVTEGRRVARVTIPTIEARSNTNLCDGFLTGAKEIGGGADRDIVRRVILISDGHANAGVTDSATLARHASELRVRGVSTATLGIGDGFDEALMSAIATGGGGPAQYAGDPEQIGAAIAECIGEALEVTLRDAHVVIRVPGADIELLSAGDVNSRRGELRVALGDLAESQEREVVLRVRLPLGSEGEQIGLTAELSGRDEAGEVLMEQAYAWTYAGSAENDAQPRNRVVDRVVAQLFAAEARERAIALNRDGDYERAQAVMVKVARRIATYAGDDRKLAKLVTDLLSEAEQWSRPAHERLRKESYHYSQNMMQSRMEDGSARKRDRR
ncbi:MAG: VWA domain-containing protein [Chloroflexi bacterium]|nr:VWA domain-containing protein [Chloroflexota bacterium]